MEILSQTTHWGLFTVVLIIAIIAALIMLLSAICGIVKVTKFNVLQDYIETGICFILTALFAIATVVIIQQGPDVTYKAKITDFNSVYKHGYEVIDHDGKLYTLKKEAK